jgi:hypothetical protein
MGNANLAADVEEMRMPTTLTKSTTLRKGVPVKVGDAARDLAGSMLVAARDVTRAASVAGTRTKAAASSSPWVGSLRRRIPAPRSLASMKLAQATRTTMQSLPKEAVPEVAKSVYRLRKVRTPAQATEAVETETEHLLTVVMPLLVAHPLPVQRTSSAKVILAAAGGLAAAGEEIETIAALVSAGTAVPPTLPIVIGANIVALAVELYVAASLRIHDLRAAGIEPTPHQVADDVIFAMTGEGAKRGLRRHVTKHVVKTVARRLLARWGAGLVPVAGIAYMGWDMQRTADTVRALPLPLAASSRVVATTPDPTLPPAIA